MRTATQIWSVGEDKLVGQGTEWNLAQQRELGGARGYLAIINTMGRYFERFRCSWELHFALVGTQE